MSTVFAAWAAVVAVTALVFLAAASAWVMLLSVLFLSLSLLFYVRNIISLRKPFVLVLSSSIPVAGSLAMVRLTYPNYFLAHEVKEN